MDVIPALKFCDALAIDEAQFFPDLHEFLLEVEKEGYTGTVILTCLNGDSERKPWKGVTEAIPLMDDITMCKAYCTMCNNGQEASFSKCIVTKNSQNLIGGKDEYAAVCRRHFQKS